MRGDETSRKAIRLINASFQPLSVHVAQLEAPFRVLGGGGLFQLAPWETKGLVVEFAPEQSGRFRDTLAIRTGDVNQSYLNVAVTGQAR